MTLGEKLSIAASINDWYERRRKMNDASKIQSTMINLDN